MSNLNNGENALIEAEHIHERIIATGRQEAVSPFEHGEWLLRMSEKKLYKALGCKNFGEYCETKVNIRTVQAYKYINVYKKLSKDFVKSTEHIGIEKLDLLTKIPENELPTFCAEHDVKSMSVPKLSALIKELYMPEKIDATEKTNNLSKRLNDTEQILDWLYEFLRQANFCDKVTLFNGFIMQICSSAVSNTGNEEEYIKLLKDGIVMFEECIYMLSLFSENPKNSEGESL